MWLREPAVALTDLAVGVEAGVFAILLARRRGGAPRATLRARRSRPWFVLFFGSTSIAAVAGAVLHGLLPRPSQTRRVLWRISLGAIGIAALSAWCVATTLALPDQLGGRIRRAAIAVHGLYLGLLGRSDPPYIVAVATYIPGAIALSLALMRGLADRRIRRPAREALAGLGLTFAAAVAQTRRMAIHPALFDHNATYHAIQAGALLLLHRAARDFVAEPSYEGAPPDQPVARR